MADFGRVIRCGKHRYYSEAAFSLTEQTGLSDPEDAIERLASDLLEIVAAEEPPVPLDIAASVQDIREIVQSDMRASGRLVPLPTGGYRVEVRSSDPQGRQNFSIGHEIGHTLIPSYSRSPGLRTDATTGEFQQGNEEEYFCDIAARSLLLPKPLLVKQCSALPPSLASLVGLAKTFHASLEATALRLEQLRCWGCTPVIWELALKPSQKRTLPGTPLPGFEEIANPVEEFRVKFHAGRGKRTYFPQAKHVGRESEMVVGCLSDGAFEGRCMLPCTPNPVECYVEALALPYRNEHGQNKQRIISLVF